MVRIMARMPEGLAERLKIRAVKEHTSIQELVTRAIEALLKTPLRREEGAR
jgi:hypothetical protein